MQYKVKDDCDKGRLCEEQGIQTKGATQMTKPIETSEESHSGVADQFTILAKI